MKSPVKASRSTPFDERNPAGKSAGFTLFELLIVVSVIGAMAAVAVPTLGASQSRRHAWVAAEHASEVVARAATDARRYGQPVRVIFDDRLLQMTTERSISGSWSDAETVAVGGGVARTSSLKATSTTMMNDDAVIRINGFGRVMDEAKLTITSGSASSVVRVGTGSEGAFVERQ